MSTARFLLALACFCTSAGVCAASESATELELGLARKPDLYLRLDVTTHVLQVMVRGMELDRMEVGSVRLITERAPGDPTDERPDLPAVWHIASAPELPWRKVVAPPTLVPFQEGLPAPTPAPTATPSSELPAQYDVQLDGGWTLHLGPDPPVSLWQRWWRRLTTGWRRLTRRPVESAPPAIAITTSADDSRRLLHILRPGTALLVRCGQPPDAFSETAERDSPSRPPA